MPLPWDTLVPFGIIFAVSVILGEAIEATHRHFKHGKVDACNHHHHHHSNMQLPRRILDDWEKKLIARDERITGDRFLQYVCLY